MSLTGQRLVDLLGAISAREYSETFVSVLRSGNAILNTGQLAVYMALKRDSSISSAISKAEEP